MRRRNQPDKSIMTMDSACAWQVMNKGNGGELELDCIYQIIERESGIHVDALALTDEELREYKEMNEKAKMRASGKQVESEEASEASETKKEPGPNTEPDSSEEPKS